MNHKIYGKKMFIIDLILVSIWGLFFSRYCTPGLMLIIPIRIALSFEMDRNSPWTLISAIGFLIAYSSVDYLGRPFERMFYTFFCAIGESDLMTNIFPNPLEWEMEAWLGSITTIWFIWLALLPVVIGIRFHNLREINWKHKWIWIYLLPLTAFCVWVMFDEGQVGGILLGLVISFLPVMYWSLYEREGRSLIQLLISDKKVLWYLFYATLMLSALTIGLKDIASMKLIGLMVLPPLFYMMLTITMRLGTILTRCCISLSLSGLLYWLSFDAGKTGTIIFLSMAIGLIFYVGVTMVFKTRTWVAPCILALVLPVIMIPCILGLNPYTVIDADYTRLYITNVSVRNGVYVVEKYFEGNEKGLHYPGRKYGLRDRYGIILPMKYNELKSLDRWGRYIETNSPDRYGNLKSEQRYGVFDLKNRKFVVNPDNIDVSELEKIDDSTFRLINPEGRYFATLYMPGEYRGEYFPHAHLEPHFADGETSVDEFLGRAQNPDLDVDDEIWRNMRKDNPHAYRLLIQMMELGSEESSPANDLNYARAIREIIRSDSHYRGNIDKALGEVAQLSESITDSGSQSDINVWTDYLRLIASIKTSLSYDALISENSQNEWINKEYVAWHNLMEAMTYYLDYLYSAESYRAVLEEKNTVIIGWLNYRRESLERDLEILSGKLSYSVPKGISDSIKGNNDFDNLFSKFHSYSDPYYYDPMWNEIKASFDEWKFSRTKIAEQLEPHESLSYKEYSREVIAKMFSFIEELDKPCFRPAL